MSESTPLPPMTEDERVDTMRRLAAVLSEMVVEGTANVPLDERHPGLVADAERMLLEDMPLVWFLLRASEQRQFASQRKLAESVRSGFGRFAKALRKGWGLPDDPMADGQAHGCCRSQRDLGGTAHSLDCRRV